MLAPAEWLPAWAMTAIHVTTQDITKAEKNTAIADLETIIQQQKPNTFKWYSMQYMISHWTHNTTTI